VHGQVLHHNIGHLQAVVVPAPLRMHLQVDAKEAIPVVIKEL
jgi:hypothetical protein